MLRYLSLASGRIFEKRPPLDSDWVIELNIPDRATLRKIRRAISETYRVERNRAEREKRLRLLRAMLSHYMTGR